MIDREQVLVGNGIEIGSKKLFMSETEPESEPENFLGRKRNRIRKASISRNGIGNGIGIGIRKYLKRATSKVVTDILNK